MHSIVCRDFTSFLNGSLTRSLIIIFSVAFALVKCIKRIEFCGWRIQFKILNNIKDMKINCHENIFKKASLAKKSALIMHASQCACAHEAFNVIL